jgi:DNA repair protein SbcD/Mre11
MIKIIFLADSHLGFDYPLRPKKEKRRRGIDFFHNFDEVLSYAKNNNADLVIHGGDLFYRTLVPAPIIDMVYERIFDFAQSGIPIVIVPGNHESSRLPVSLFMQHPNIHYYTKAQIFKFSFKGVNFDIAGFPCIRKDVFSKFPGIANEIQSLLRTESVKLLCMHQSIGGAKVGPSDFTFRKSKDVIPIEDLPTPYNLILSGHIHRTQILWSKNKTPILYPGSIERTAFAEKDEEKGFYEIDFNDNLDCTYRFVHLKTRPMIDVFLEKDTYTLSTLKNDILSQIKDIPSDSIVRFKLNNTAHLHLLNVKLLDAIIPSTMNYQIAGYRDRS